MTERPVPCLRLTQDPRNRYHSLPLALFLRLASMSHLLSMELPSGDLGRSGHQTVLSTWDLDLREAWAVTEWSFNISFNS